MKSPLDSHHQSFQEADAQRDDFTDEPFQAEGDAFEAEPEADENELDESDLQDADDDRWDVFILDDDDDAVPEYGDFWFPD